MKEYYELSCFDKTIKKNAAVPLEYMVSVLLSLEFNLNFHIEALKACAVIIRTNLIRNQTKTIEVDLSKIDEASLKKANKIVKETKGIIITYNGKPIDAKYHLTCGGSTENSENILGNHVFYLRRVLCDYCKDSPYWKNEKKFSIEEIQQLLKDRIPKLPMDDIEIVGFMEDIKRDDYGRVIYIKVGNKIFSGKELMELLDLDSTRFVIIPTEVKFISRGKGHGMGLCLYGANKMAEEGFSFEEILKYYYTGIEISKAKLPSEDKPLHGRSIVIDPGHGGDDEGFKGDFLQLLEKDIVLDISLKLKMKLEQLGAKVFLTRDKDEKVLATTRVEKTNEINPDFFISIHLDYYPNSKMKGVEIFYFRGDEVSKNLGLAISNNLKEAGIQTRGVKEGNFYIFREIGTSSMMFEAGFLSNKDEEIKFKNDEYIDKLVTSIAKGISNYFISSF